MLVIPLNIAFIVRLVTTMAPASDLSPAAQAVLDAAYRRMDDNPHNEVEATLAAALRAAAGQVVIKLGGLGQESAWYLEEIATELEAQ